MSLVCGVDCSTLNRPNWVAWLDDGHFILDAYLPTQAHPLPALTIRPGTVRCYAFDAPQGLPMPDKTSRECDRLASAPARRGRVEVGVSIFWWVFDQNLATVAGLPVMDGRLPTVCETYPRYVIKRLWPGIRFPSKKTEPLAYIDAIYSEIQKLGFVCRSVARPTVDQVDAMVCALAANAIVGTEGLPAGSVGEGPHVDHESRVLRGGYIVSP